MTERPCKACGMPLVFVESGASGKQLPLQKVRTVYYIGSDGAAYKVDLAGGDEDGLRYDGDHYVSHFETCPQAGRFTRRA